MNRTGSTSTFNFATSVFDQFPILGPYTPESEVQQPNSLIQASTINRYFDAVVNIESFILANLGGRIQSAATSYGVMSYSSISFVASSTSMSFLVTVPSGMGTNPFLDPGFSVHKSLQFNTSVGSSLDISSDYYNKYSHYGNYTTLLYEPQFFISVAPVSGRVCSVNINSYNFGGKSRTPMGGITDDFVRLSITQSGDSESALWQPNNQNSSFYIANSLTYPAFLQIQTANVPGASGGVLLANTLPADNWQVVFSLTPAPGLGFYSTTGTNVLGRQGPCICFTGSATNASFYCLSIGDFPNSAISNNSTYGGTFNPLYYARLMRVTGCNLYSSFYSGLAWNSATVLGSGSIVFNDSVGSYLGPYINLNTNPTYAATGGVMNYRLTKTGSSFNFETNSGTGWVQYPGFPVTDPTPLPGLSGGQTPFAGWFAQNLQGNGSAIAYYGCAFNPLNTGYPCKLDLLFLNTSGYNPIQTL